MVLKPLCLILLTAAAPAQVLVRGRVIDSATGQPLAHAQIEAASADRGSVRTARSDKSGRFMLAGGDPGIYSLRASASGYQPTEIVNLKLAQGGANLDFRLRPLSDVWETDLGALFMPG